MISSEAAQFIKKPGILDQMTIFPRKHFAWNLLAAVNGRSIRLISRDDFSDADVQASPNDPLANLHRLRSQLPASNSPRES